MKNLFFAIMAILLINVTYAGEVGEDMKGECVDGIQSSRFQSQIADAEVEAESTEESSGVTAQ